MSDTLTPKQEAFAQKYLETGNASEAYRQAYDADGMKPATINRKAKDLLDNGKIAARVNTLKQRALKRHDVTLDSITTELDEARAMAREDRQMTAMISASMSKAKLHGLVTDKSDVTVRKPIAEMTDDELNDGIAEYERTAGTIPPRTEG
ncbi:terminase small subunit [Zavarzinella formosa]|uniref:terminase small subunit n=1 Tax=Zavarzinella formosa TaxID=360055 RepID=UPI00030D8FE5|nr:terminase small subunit [Zavarzinella formosa]